MGETGSTVLAQAGEQLLLLKWFLTAVQCLWIYDYLLTLGDEIQYAWSGRKSWVFLLFIANRYTPLVNLAWAYVTMFHYEKPFCEATKWIPIFHAGAIAVFAHTAIALRVYAITGKNKFIAGALALVITAELCHGIFSSVWIGLGSLQPLPEIDLDAFTGCIYKRWKVGELIYYGMETFFDVLAFSIIVFTAREPRMSRHPKIPSILDTILRDSTEYFILVFSAQFSSLIFLFAVPENFQLIPAIANSVVVPVMASRLMLSLKKATIEPRVMWSLETMTNLSRGGSTKDSTIRFASRAPRGPGGTLLTSAGQDEGDIELNSEPRSPQIRGPRYIR